MADYYRPDNPWRTAPEADPASAVLAEVWGDNHREAEQGHRRYPEHVARLLAAVRDVLKLADGWDANAAAVPLIDREAAACAVRGTISAALLGEGASGG
jgi:hypothetical protein